MRCLSSCATLLALISLAACQRATDVRPSSELLGEWRLAVSGGGITGVMSPVPAGSDTRVVFGPDSAYARYYNGHLVEATTFQLRTRPSTSGGPDEQLLVLKTYNTPTGQPSYYPYYITQLASDQLHVTTGGGCALNSEYVRVSSPTLPATAP